MSCTPGTWSACWFSWSPARRSSPASRPPCSTSTVTACAYRPSKACAGPGAAVGCCCTTTACAAPCCSAAPWSTSAPPPWPVGPRCATGASSAGAALLATENAPAGKRAWFGMFPQLGPSIGFLAANGLFLALAMLLSEEQFRDWGWRIPFLLSAALVVVGLYVRLKLAETPVFAKAMAKHERVRLPIAELFAQHWRPTLLGALAMVVCYALFYISTVFSLSYGVASLGFSREEFLGLLCLAVLFMAAATPLSAWLSDRFGRKPVLLLGSLAAIASGFAMEPLLSQGSTFSVALFLCIELFLMGVTFAPMGALLPEIFPTHVRYTGASAAYNLGGILGASVAPYIAQKLVGIGGLGWVGGYVSAAALLSLLAVLCLKETRDNDLGAVS
ncbi:MFS transporter [Pseudomonas aeruginosa VRFPA03]|nr:MFS transporter [Pseudomonas aeruginosa VRFPA03]